MGRGKTPWQLIEDTLSIRGAKGKRESDREIERQWTI